MNRILVAPDELQGGRVVLADRRAVHIREVLRSRVGDRLAVGVMDGAVGEGEIVAVGSRDVVIECRLERVPPAPSVDLILALPRPKVMRRLWAPLASLGVGRITVVNAAKVEASYFATHWLLPEHRRPLLIEGLEQSGDTHLPSVEIERRFRPFVEDRLPERYAGWSRLLLHPDACLRLIEVALPPGGRAVIAIGPEGGWSAYERERFAACGFDAVRLGPRVLRTDTACISALSIANERLAR
jgi:RsmE family RNA methyltransferase